MAGVEILKDYTRNNLFELGDVYWVWKVVVVPTGTSRTELVKIAKHLFSSYPRARMRLFDDKAQLEQFIQRDIYFNDKSGTAKEVPFPEEWTVVHHLANIHDRSDLNTGRWQLVTRHGEHIAFLD